MTKYQIFETYKFAGYPMVDTRARFFIPTPLRRRHHDRDHDDGSQPFELRHQHHLNKDGALAVEAFETRVWVGRPADDPSKIKSQPVPDEVIARSARPDAAAAGCCLRRDGAIRPLYRATLRGGCIWGSMRAKA